MKAIPAKILDHSERREETFLLVTTTGPLPFQPINCVWVSKREREKEKKRDSQREREGKDAYTCICIYNV